MREMRAAWVATVANIDWPSTNAVTTTQQKAELLAILERATQLRLNTIIFQVRPACDALYASSIEPWSEYLTGTMGRVPDPYYDPLAFAITEAHKRGLELHAWFNPYRARHLIARSSIASKHISKTHPELVRQYGKYLWLDPGEKAVQDYSLQIVMDVVRRYDIDGVHFDDYFYPYAEKDRFGRDLDFPDESSWRRYGVSTGLNREDWRRENVNVFIHRVYETIKAAKPWVKLGISPFGIWRPGNPAQIQGFDSYARLYADSRKWLVNGWLDYLAPQLYWGIRPPEQSFPVLLKWWAEQNPKSRLLVAGIDATKTSRRSDPWKPSEIVEQVSLTRQQNGVGGQVFWNMGTLLRNKALEGTLQKEAYMRPALVPASTWLDSTIPRTPNLKTAGYGRRIDVKWETGKEEHVRLFVLQTRRRNEWLTELFPDTELSCTFEMPWPDVIALSTVDRYGNASHPAVLERKGD
jgi:uncharacterized lipoprotein YddW (UPF0748 family)